MESKILTSMLQRVDFKSLCSMAEAKEPALKPFYMCISLASLNTALGINNRNAELEEMPKDISGYLRTMMPSISLAGLTRCG